VATPPYDYDLPRELIAQKPLAQRADARLLVVDRAAQTLTHQHVRDLPELLRPKDCLVINDTRVVPARLLGQRTMTGGRWEGLFIGIDPGSPDCWQLLAKTRGKASPRETITLVNREGREDVLLRLIDRLPGGMWLARPETEEETWSLLDRVGRVPLPHYIRGGEMTDEDSQRYQTVYARHPGAVAAPTAGLHFTPELLERLTERGVGAARVTLHVGMGTFRPIATDSLDEHIMHSERGTIDSAAVEQIRRAKSDGGRVIAVGTTAVRVLETAARDGELKPWAGETDLFIRPPYRFKVVDALMTNFHLPRTTLLVLVRTFGGDGLIMRAYDEAIREQYRFYSYGDSMLMI
jgi:S-adenosylmethionine:tRNA ribosyltransferase-isomerase